MKFKIDENLPFLFKKLIENYGDHWVDSVYHENPKMSGWYCVDCYRDLPANLKPDWEPDYPLTEAQIKEFFKKLNRRADQIKFINICKEYGGYNDIEILINAQKEIYDDFGIEIP